MAHNWKNRSDVNPIFGQIEDLKISYLPKNSDVLKSIFYVQNKSAKSLIETYHEVANKVIKVWQTNTNDIQCEVEKSKKKIRKKEENNMANNSNEPNDPGNLPSVRLFCTKTKKNYSFHIFFPDMEDTCLLHVCNTHTCYGCMAHFDLVGGG